MWAAGSLTPLVYILMNAAFPPHIVLSDRGFRTLGWMRGRLVPWKEADKFWVLRTPLYSYVLYATAHRAPRTRFGLWVFRGLPSEADGRFMPFYDLKAEALAEVLTTWKLRYGK